MARPPSLDPIQLRVRLQASGPTSAQALADEAGVDRRTVQRVLGTLGVEVEQLGRTRNTRYAVRRQIYGSSAPLPIARFDERGVAQPWATLTPLHGGWRLAWASETARPDWAQRLHDHAGFCEGLPFFLTDLRPQGFLGRAIARTVARTTALPEDPRNWSDDHTLFYLRQHGHDLPGNLVCGPAVEHALNAPPAPELRPDERAHRYPAWALAANAGEPVGSSVEGEQPKFTAWLRDPQDSSLRAVLVKFTDRLDTPSGRRWADLLAAEAIALRRLNSVPAPTALTDAPRIFDFGGRRFLEVPRYDRLAAHGRRGVVSLRALHDAGFTARETSEWSVAAAALHEQEWIGADDLRAVRTRALFGRLIGNTDMHFGNLAFFLDSTLPLRLAPTYDMLPMLWAPRSGDATPRPDFAPRAPRPDELDCWTEAVGHAEQFWTEVEADDRISEEFRSCANAAAGAIRTLRARFG